MKIYFDTSQKDLVRLMIGGQSFEYLVTNRSSQILLPFLLSTLRDLNMKLSDVSEISFNTGPGSFTGLRVGAAVAQALAWSLTVPLNGKKDSLHLIKLNYSPSSFD